MVDDRFAVSQIGLGNMGSAIGAAIASAGHDLTVWNRTEAKSHALGELELRSPNQLVMLARSPI